MLPQMMTRSFGDGGGLGRGVRSSAVEGRQKVESRRTIIQLKKSTKDVRTVICRHRLASTHFIHRENGVVLPNGSIATIRGISFS